MVRLSSMLFTMCVAAVLGLSTAAHAEKIKNPEYAKWEKFKPGAYTRLAGNGGSPGHAVQQTMTTKLLELDADKAVVEMRIVLENGDKQVEMTPIKQEIKSSVEFGETKKPDGMNDNNTAINQSQEKLTIGDKTYDCDVTEVIMNRQGMKVAVKTWTTPDVPGWQVKVERTTDSKTKFTTSMIMTEMKTGS